MLRESTISAEVTPVTTRAQLLGYSVEVNLKFYSYAEKDNLQEVCDLLDSRQVNPWSPRNSCLPEKIK
ncbi:MAG: hypothetical protein IJ716_14120 [Lachnospiraceae bacterium]|nr:hypothetical protein [Lachnospiraceae bacterium]